jgi:hypothetical protein
MNLLSDLDQVIELEKPVVTFSKPKSQKKARKIKKKGLAVFGNEMKLDELPLPKISKKVKH